MQLYEGNLRPIPLRIDIPILESFQAISTHAHLWITLKNLEIIISFFESTNLWHLLKIVFGRVRTLIFGQNFKQNVLYEFQEKGKRANERLKKQEQSLFYL